MLKKIWVWVNFLMASPGGLVYLLGILQFSFENVEYVLHLLFTLGKWRWNTSWVLSIHPSVHYL